jgi:hypothetical protein
VWAAGLAGAAVVLFVAYLRLSGTYAATSDGADQALQGWDMLHGNWLLHGWTLGDVTYYTTEIPEYMLIELVRGLGADVVHIAGAITYTLLVLAAGLLARGRATGRDGLIRLAIAAGIMLAPQFGNATHLLLSQPDHLGTQLPLLLVFLMLDRAPRRWYIPVAAGVALTWVVIADRVALLTAVVPLALVCGARVLLAVLRRRRSLASQWYELSLIAASALSFAAAELTVRLISLLNGYQVTPVASAKLAVMQFLPHHIQVTVRRILNMYGADFFGISNDNPFGPELGGLPVGVGVALAVVHLVGLALAVWGFFRAFRHFFDPADLISPVLATAITINIAAYAVSIVSFGLFDAREIVAVLPFGAVLAGRMVPGSLGRARLSRARLGRVRLTPVLAGVLAGVLACYLAGLGYGAAQSPVPDNEQAVIPWLEAHHLTSGLGTYAESNLLTLDSGGRITIREIAWQSTGDVPRSFETKASWYDPRHSYANFVLTNSADQWGMDGGGPGVPASMIPLPAIAALHAGPPAHVYHYKTFTIMVWNHNLLDNLDSPPSVQPGEVPCTHDCV